MNRKEYEERIAKLEKELEELIARFGEEDIKKYYFGIEE